MSDRISNALYLRAQKKSDVFPDCEKSGSPAADTLILGLGNPLRGDDGVGIVVLKKLIDSCALPQNTTCHQCSRGGLLDELLSEHYQRVIIIDAVEMGFSPGTWIRVQIPHTEVTSMTLETWRTLHDINLAEVIALGETLDLLPREIVVYGIQSQEAGWGPTLSKPVQVAVEKVKNVILEELSDW